MIFWNYTYGSPAFFYFSSGLMVMARIIGDWTIHIMSALFCKVREMGVPSSSFESPQKPF